MLSASNDASRKVNTKENKKNENQDENLKSHIQPSDYIPLDKDFPPNKSQTRQQRDRSQQKSSHYKTSYYNSNRYQSRGVYNGNNTLASSKAYNNGIRGHYNRNTHTNYTGNPASNYQSLNAEPNNYNRTKRKRDSSAISTHEGNGKTHNKTLSDLGTSADSIKPCDELSIIATEDNQPKNNLSTKSKCTAQGAFPRSLQETSLKEDITSNNEACKGQNLDCSKRHHILVETKENSESLDGIQLTNSKEKSHNKSPVSAQNYSDLKNTSAKRSQQDVYFKSKATNDFSASIKNQNNKENTKIKSFFNTGGTHENERDNKNNAFATAQKFPVWHREKPYGGGVIGLHEEIEDFFQWMVPTALEHERRIDVVNRIRLVIRNLWPQAKVDIFGSFKTGLYLPTSDIDLVICGHWPETSLPLHTLYDELVKSQISKSDEIIVLDKAAVPIIKLTERITEIKVDISFNTVNGIRAAELIKFYKKHYPTLPKLIYVLKQFLLQRNLNEVFTGGLSSYALILMAVSFLQLHPRNDASTLKTNLGVLLLEFFDLYGRSFNYSQSAIRVRDGGAYVPRDEILRNLPPGSSGNNGTTLCIEDPLDSTNDVGRGSFLFYRVKSTFEDAYITLQRELGTRKLFREPSSIETTSHRDIDGDEGLVETSDGCNSILSRIISVSDDIQQFRRHLTEYKSVSHGEKPKLPEKELEKTIDDSKINQQPNLQPLNEKHCQMDCTSKSPTMSSRKMPHSKTSYSTKTSNLKVSESSSKETGSVTTHHPNAKAVLNHVSDDPSAPIYPPRSPTSDIVPKDLQPCHWRQYPGIPHFNGTNETPIDQLDGSIENIEEGCSVRRLCGSSSDGKVVSQQFGAKSLVHVPESKNLDSIEVLLRSQDESLQENNDILALMDKSKCLSNSRHSSSSSSVSSIGSSSSSSLRESMSDTHSDIVGPADQPLPSDSSNSSMSISPAVSEVGSPSGISGSKGTSNSTRALFSELTYLDVEKGIKKSPSGNLVNCNKEVSYNGSVRRIRTSSHSSNTSSFSTSSKVGSRKELDRADMDLDWRSSSRLRCSSGSSEESIKSKKSDDRVPVRIHRADRDLNWRNHDDILSNSPNTFISSQRSNWRSKNAKQNKNSCRDKPNFKSCDGSSVNDNENTSNDSGSNDDLNTDTKISNTSQLLNAGAASLPVTSSKSEYEFIETPLIGENKMKIPLDETIEHDKIKCNFSDLIQKTKVITQVSNVRTLNEVVENAVAITNNKLTNSQKMFSDDGQDSVLPSSPTPSNSSLCSGNSSSSSNYTVHNLTKENLKRDKRRKMKTKIQSQTSNPKSNERVDEKLISNDNFKQQDKIRNMSTSTMSKDPKYDHSIAQPSKTQSTHKENKLNGVTTVKTKSNIQDTLSSPNSYSCSNSIGSSRRRFSNKLGHKKSKR